MRTEGGGAGLSGAPPKKIFRVSLSDICTECVLHFVFIEFVSDKLTVIRKTAAFKSSHRAGT